MTCCRYVLHYFPHLKINFQLVGRLTHSITLTGYTFATISCWIVVALTIDRLVLIKLPYKAAKLSTAKRTYLALAAIILFCCVFNSVWAVELYEVHVAIMPCTGLWNIPKEVVKSDGTVYTPLRYRDDYTTYAAISTVLLLYALPVIIIVVCNTLISRSFSNQTFTMVKNPAKLRKRRRREQRLCKMILVVSIMFVICNIPDIVTRLLWKFISPVIVSKIQPVAHLILMVNAAANFIVYSLMNRHLFRTIFRMLSRFCHCCGSDPGSDRLPTATDSALDTSDKPQISISTDGKSNSATKTDTSIGTCSDL